MSKFIFGAVAVTAVLVGSLSGCKKPAEGAVSGNFGTVDGTPITYEEFYSYLQHKPTVQVSAQGRSIALPVAGQFGVQAMRDIVQQKILASVAKDEGVLPTKEDVDKELAFRTKQNPNYIANLEKVGLSMDDIRQETMNILTSEKLQTKGVVVSPEEAKKYISANKAAFTNPPTANLLVIAVSDPKAKAAADADLKSGQSFAAVAMKYSIVPGARESGGAFQGHDVSKMEPSLQALVNSTAEGKSSDWKKVGTNWIRFYVQSKTPAKPVPVDATLIEEVQRDLAKQKGTPNSADLQKRILEKLKTVKVDFSSPVYQDGWNQFKDQVTATAAAPAPKPGK